MLPKPLVGIELRWPAKEAVRFGGGLLARGATVHLLCRSLERGEAARAQLHTETGIRPELWRLDVSNLSGVRDFVGRFSGDVDILVNNAGVLPHERMLTPDGLERTWATNVVGPFLLTERLLDRLGRSQDGRVITVCSGGMLLQKLQLFDVNWSKRRKCDGTAEPRATGHEITDGKCHRELHHGELMILIIALTSPAVSEEQLLN